jgi:hypothetical protein
MGFMMLKFRTTQLPVYAWATRATLATRKVLAACPFLYLVAQAWP